MNVQYEAFDEAGTPMALAWFRADRWIVTYLDSDGIWPVVDEGSALQALIDMNPSYIRKSEIVYSDPTE